MLFRYDASCLERWLGAHQTCGSAAFCGGFRSRDCLSIRAGGRRAGGSTRWAAHFRDSFRRHSIAAVVQAALIAGMAAVVMSRAGLVLTEWSRASRRLVWVVVAFSGRVSCSTCSLRARVSAPSGHRGVAAAGEQCGGGRRLAPPTRDDEASVAATSLAVTSGHYRWELVWPSLEYLPSYVAALSGGGLLITSVVKLRRGRNLKILPRTRKVSWPASWTG